MYGKTTRLPRSAAIVLIGGASFVAVIALVLVTILLKPMASTAVSQRELNGMPPGTTLPALDEGSSAQGNDPEAQGELPSGATAFDEQYPGIANIDPALLQALREASTAAAAEGITVKVNSGWRSAEYQGQLYREAIETYGSEEEAARWVATPETSAHVSGSAVDIGDVDATSWFSQFGAAYGLCQTYENEAWHYELRPEAAAEGCPAMSTDATVH